MLLLTGERRWSGTGKGLLRELATYDADHATTHAVTLPAALRAATTGDVEPLTFEVDTILAPYGGRLFEGFRLTGSLQTAAAAAISTATASTATASTATASTAASSAATTAAATTAAATTTNATTSAAATGVPASPGAGVPASPGAGVPGSPVAR